MCFSCYFPVSNKILSLPFPTLRITLTFQPIFKFLNLKWQFSTGFHLTKKFKMRAKISKIFTINLKTHLHIVNSKIVNKIIKSFKPILKLTTFDIIYGISTSCLLTYLKIRKIKGAVWSPPTHPSGQYRF